MGDFNASGDSNPGWLVDDGLAWLFVASFGVVKDSCLDSLIVCRRAEMDKHYHLVLRVSKLGKNDREHINFIFGHFKLL